MNKWKDGDVFRIGAASTTAYVLLAKVGPVTVQLIDLEHGNRWSDVTAQQDIGYYVSNRQLANLLTPNYTKKVEYLGKINLLLNFLPDSQGTPITLSNTLVGTAGGYDFEM